MVMYGTSTSVTKALNYYKDPALYSQYKKVEDTIIGENPAVSVYTAGLHYLIQAQVKLIVRGCLPLFMSVFLSICTWNEYPMFPGYWIRLSESVKGGLPPFFCVYKTKAYDSFLSLLHPCVRLKTG